MAKLDFGEVYFGDVRSEAVYLVNMGCVPVRFCAACGTQSGSRDGEGSRNAALPQQLAHASLVQVTFGGSRPWHITDHKPTVVSVFVGRP